MLSRSHLVVRQRQEKKRLVKLNPEAAPGGGPPGWPVCAVAGLREGTSLQPSTPLTMRLALPHVSLARPGIEDLDKDKAWSGWLAGAEPRQAA